MKTQLRFWGSLALAMLFALFGAGTVLAQNIQRLEPKPLADQITGRMSPAKPGAENKMFSITWGPDGATLYAADENLFPAKVTVTKEDSALKQLLAIINGETVWFRGTMDMYNVALPAIHRAGGDLTVVYLLSRSTGGDNLVVREHVRGLGDIKKVAIQYMGPHQYWMYNAFSLAGLDIGNVEIVWLEQLTLPREATTQIVDPVSAFRADPTIDAVFCITPDMLVLTSDGKVGTGADDSVKGARNFMSTKTADQVIYDVYAVRTDYFNANRTKIGEYVNALLRAQEAVLDLQSRAGSDPRAKEKYNSLLTRMGGHLLDAPQDLAGTEGLLLDATFAGHAGNVAFFTGQGTIRTFDAVSAEIQTAFTRLGLMGGTAKATHANWDWNTLSRGLRNTQVASTPRFDAAAAQKAAEAAILAEPTRWADEGTLFVVEIKFAPNQSVFSAEQYRADFDAALQRAMTYGGAQVFIEGHADPTGVQKARKDGKPQGAITEMEQVAKNLSLARAGAVRTAFIEYAKQRGLVIDESQFIATGIGVRAPMYPEPATREEWDANRRVVFRLKEFNVEATDFVAPK